VDNSVSASKQLREAARQAGKLRLKTRELLRQEAITGGQENLQAVEDLIDHYITLRLDPSLGDFQRQRLTGLVRSRLLGVKDRLRLEEKRAHTAAEIDTQSIASRKAQGPPPPAVAEREAADSRLAERAVRRAADSVAQLSHLVLAQQVGAGPAGQAAAGALAAAPPLATDYGPDLVDLIETVIAPSTWERNGGPGSIYYYRPLRVLVIRQTGEVHGQIGDTIGALRRAGN
jgi:hypothetical protein